MAWETLAAASRTAPDPGAGLRRIWVTTPGAVLAFAALARSVAQYLTIAPEGIRIRSWYDECLGHPIPDPVRWGTAWLHGLSLTLPAGTEPRLVVDDQTIDTVTLDRDPNTGATILTVIDADERSSLTPGLIAIASGETSAAHVADGSLRNVTHWGFCVSGAVCRNSPRPRNSFRRTVRCPDWRFVRWLRVARGRRRFAPSRRLAVAGFRRRRAAPDRASRGACSAPARRRAEAASVRRLAGAAAARMASRSQVR